VSGASPPGKNGRVCGYFLCLHTGPVHRKLISLLLVNRL